MTKTNTWLAGAFAVQMALVALVWSSSGTSEVEAARALIEGDIGAITTVTITGRTTLDQTTPPEAITLAREGEGWLIASAGGYPAQTGKVNEVLESLQAIQVRTPVGTSQGSHVGLGVAGDAFTRRLTLTSGEGETTVYLGAATGSAMHIRLADDERVYLHRGTTAWSIGDQANRYFDPIYLEEDLDRIEQISVSNPTGQYMMTRGEEGWRAVDRETTQGVEQGEADALVRGLLTVRMMEPVTRDVSAVHGLEQGSRVSWTVIEDTTTRSDGYTIGAKADDRHHYVKADGSDWVVKVLSSSVERALETEFSFLDTEGTNADP